MAKLSIPVMTVVGAMILAGCTGSDGESSRAESAATTADARQSASAVLAANKASHSEPGDTTWSDSGAVSIVLSGTTAASSGDGVTIKGATVTITRGGTYRFSGSLRGQVVVDAGDDTVKLVLAGAEIASSSTAAIAVTNAGKAIVILANGTKNSLSDTSSYGDGAVANAALFSAADLTIAGGGSLQVQGNGNDAITSKDGLIIDSGTITVSAVDDGIRGKDYLVINQAAVTVTAGGDGLKSDNDEDPSAGYISVTNGTVAVTSGADAADAATDLVVSAGRITLVSGGGSTARVGENSAKGLKAGVIVVVDGGDVSVNAADDAVHSNDAVHISGGTLTLASGDDAVHADDEVLIDGGTVTITSSYEGIEGAHIAIEGGTITVVATDDGINAGGSSGGAVADGQVQGGQNGQPQQGPGGFGGGEQVGDFSLVIAGGTLVITAAGDGFDSNGTAKITGGIVVVNGPTNNGNGALDVNGDFQISGGILLAAGSSGMAIAPSAQSGQGWISATVTSTIPAGATLQIADSSGALLATFVTAKSVQNIVYSAPAVKSGSQYVIYSGGTASGTRTGGLAQSGSLDAATQIATVTAGQAAATGMGGMGQPGQNQPGAGRTGQSPPTR